MECPVQSEHHLDFFSFFKHNPVVLSQSNLRIGVSQVTCLPQKKTVVPVQFSLCVYVHNAAKYSMRKTGLSGISMFRARYNEIKNVDKMTNHHYFLY